MWPVEQRFLLLPHPNCSKFLQPSSAHLGSLAVCFLFSAASAAAPTLLLASAKIAGVRGDVHVIIINYDYCGNYAEHDILFTLNLLLC